MHFLRTTSTARLLALVLGVAVVAAATAAIALAASGGSGQKPPPKPLAQAVHDALSAPAVDGVTARIKFTNHLIDSGAVVGQTPLISGASGRLWASSDGKLRLELQSTSGDVQLTSDGKSFLVYDGASNTAYRGEIPQHQGQSKPDAGAPSVSKIQKSIDQARQHGSVSGAIPTTVAGRSAYEVRVVPQHGGLVSGARLAWDAARGVPLKVSVYARGNASPVLSLSAQHISFGKVAASTFAISPPKGAHVVDLTPRSSGPNAAHGKDVTGLSAVQKAVGFSVSAPDKLAGKTRQDVKQVGQDGALVTYGTGSRRHRGVREEGRRPDPDRPARPARRQRPLAAHRLDQRHHRAGARHRARHGGAVHARRRAVHGARVAAGGRRDRRGPRPLAMPEGAPVEVRGLVKRYGDIVAVDGVDLTVEPGDVYGYLGPNGAGKTTSLRMMLGLIRPTAGQVRMFGRDPLVTRACARRRGRLRGGAALLPLPERRGEPAHDGRLRRRRRRTSASTRRSSWSNLADRAKDRVGGYSHGMRQRLGIAGALLRDPRLMLLDEPATGLDPGGMRDMRELVRRLASEGITVVLSSHLLSEVEELCNRRGDRAQRAHGLRGPPRASCGARPAAATGCAPPTTACAERVCRAQPARRRTCARRTARSASRADEPAVAELSVALVESGAAILALSARARHARGAVLPPHRGRRGGADGDERALAPRRASRRHERPSVRTVYRWELRKLRAQKRTYLGLGAAAAVPVIFVVATSLRGGGPNDVAFGRYIHDTGLAIPLVLLLFGSIWLFPLITALVAGDIVASEDGNGTLKTILTRSVERGQVFAASCSPRSPTRWWRSSSTARSSLGAG